MRPKPIYNVLVGNIGHVYAGTSLEKAKADFEEYKSQSINGYGRAAGEQVSLLENGEPLFEHFPQIKYYYLQEDAEDKEIYIMDEGNTVCLLPLRGSGHGASQNREEALVLASKILKALNA